MTASREAIVESAMQAAFGKPLVNNVLRALLVEAMVNSSLPKGWEWCSGDWAMCDFMHEGGTRLEVKQSAARQSWHPEDGQPSRCSFDIAARKQAWDGRKWVPSTGRNAEIYVFGHNPVTDASADHRDPAQWRFHVVPATRLPATKRLGLSVLQDMAPEVSISLLGEKVEEVRKRLETADRSVWRPGDLRRVE